MKPLFWVAPLYSPAMSAYWDRKAPWFDLLEMRGRVPVVDFTQKVRLEVELLRDLKGVFGLGMFASARAHRGFGVMISHTNSVRAADTLAFTWSLSDMTFPGGITLHGSAMNRFLTPSIQRAMAKAMSSKPYLRVRPGSELP